jgi:hypothetical protein
VDHDVTTRTILEDFRRRPVERGPHGAVMPPLDGDAFQVELRRFVYGLIVTLTITARSRPVAGP